MVFSPQSSGHVLAFPPRLLLIRLLILVGLNLDGKRGAIHGEKHT